MLLLEWAASSPDVRVIPRIGCCPCWWLRISTTVHTLCHRLTIEWEEEKTKGKVTSLRYHSGRSISGRLIIRETSQTVISSLIATTSAAAALVISSTHRARAIVMQNAAATAAVSYMQSDEGREIESRLATLQFHSETRISRFAST